MIDLIVVETNRYAQQYIVDHMPLLPHSPVIDWKPATPDKIRSFSGPLYTDGNNLEASSKYVLVVG